MSGEMIEKWHLAQINRCRKEMSQLIEDGEPLSSSRLVKLANCLTDHCLKTKLM